MKFPKTEQGSTCSIKLLAEEDNLKANITIKNADGSVPDKETIDAYKKELLKVADWQPDNSFNINYDALQFVPLNKIVVVRIETYTTNNHVYLFITSK